MALTYLSITRSMLINLFKVVMSKPNLSRRTRSLKTPLNKKDSKRNPSRITLLRWNKIWTSKSSDSKKFKTLVSPRPKLGSTLRRNHYKKTKHQKKIDWIEKIPKSWSTRVVICWPRVRINLGMRKKEPWNKWFLLTMILRDKNKRKRNQ